jgi:hypothetical protein
MVNLGCMFLYLLLVVDVDVITLTSVGMCISTSVLMQFSLFVIYCCRQVSCGGSLYQQKFSA